MLGKLTLTIQETEDGVSCDLVNEGLEAEAFVLGIADTLFQLTDHDEKHAIVLLGQMVNAIEVIAQRRREEISDEEVK